MCIVAATAIQETKQTSQPLHGWPNKSNNQANRATDGQPLHGRPTAPRTVEQANRSTDGRSVSSYRVAKRNFRETYLYKHDLSAWRSSYRATLDKLPLGDQNAQQQFLRQHAQPKDSLRIS